MGEHHQALRDGGVAVDPLVVDGDASPHATSTKATAIAVLRTFAWPCSQLDEREPVPREASYAGITRSRFQRSEGSTSSQPGSTELPRRCQG